jgi:hypothetical protein
MLSILEISKEEIKINDFNIPATGYIKVATFLRTNSYFKTNITSVDDDNHNIINFITNKLGRSRRTDELINDLIMKINRRIIRPRENHKKKCKVIQSGTKIQIPAGVVEFYAGGNTIWIQSAEGATTMRIKCSGKINVDQCKDSPVSHCDIYLEGDINFCISKDAK